MRERSDKPRIAHHVRLVCELLHVEQDVVVVVTVVVVVAMMMMVHGGGEKGGGEWEY